jgi:formate-dependent nitrite reductase membrane component NrfD
MTHYNAPGWLCDTIDNLCRLPPLTWTGFLLGVITELLALVALYAYLTRPRRWVYVHMPLQEQ